MMSKNICLLLILMLCSVAMSAQSNLQFGRVITYAGTLTTTTATGDSTATWTVPAGKVWKIESVSSAYAYTTLPVYLVVNGIRTYDIVTTTSSSTTRIVYLPIWLKAGDAIRIAEYSTSNNYFANYFISMVEFNLTP